MTPAPYCRDAVADTDALAFLSSNDVTLAQAVLAHQDLTGLRGTRGGSFR